MQVDHQEISILLRAVDELETKQACPRCGREVKLFSEASPRAVCVGCGRPPEECTCSHEQPAAAVPV